MQAGHETTYRAGAKGQLISKGLFDVIISTKKQTIFLRIIALASKKTQIKKESFWNQVTFSTRTVCGFMANLHKKSWNDSISHVYNDTLAATKNKRPNMHL